MKKIIVIFLITAIILISGCLNQTQQVVCNKPYILVGNSCCLDKNNNNICDNDEKQENKKEDITCNLPYIKVGNSCCLDKNNNRICDNDEKEDITTITKEYKSNFSISDLQSDMGKVLDRPILLTKDFNTQEFEVYSNKISNSKFLGKYGYSTYFKIFIKKPEMVIEINDKESLKNYNDFYDFVKNNKNIFIESALKSKEIFENEFKNGELPKFIYLKYKPNQKSDAERAKYINHEEISSKLFHDRISFPETVSKRIAEIFYVRVNKYKVNISANTERIEITEALSNINLAYNMIVYCNPNLIISLNEEYFGQGVSQRDTNFDDSDVDANYFLTNLRDYYTPYVRQALSLIDMCDQKYKFTYIKGTIT